MPVLDAELVAQNLGVALRAARGALASLEAAGIIASTGGCRNRRFTVPELVGVLRAAAPDGGPVRRRPTGGAQAPDPAPYACGHHGPRSERACRLPEGHAGQHRYPPTI